MLNIIKSNLLNKKNKFILKNKVKTLKHFPSSVREWYNSIYVYNTNALNAIPHSTQLAVRIIKSYFDSYNLINTTLPGNNKNYAKKKRNLSSFHVYVSNGEFKHTNNKVIINLYTFSRLRYKYMSFIKKLFLNSILNSKSTMYNNDKSFLKKSKLIKYKNTKVSDKLKYNIKGLISNTIKPININTIEKSKLENTLTTIKYENKWYKYKKNNLHMNKIINITTKESILNKYKFINVNSLFNIKLDKFNDILPIFFIKNIKPIGVKKKTIKSSRFNKYLSKRVNLINKKGLVLIKLTNIEKYLLIKKLKKNQNINIYNISSYIDNFNKKLINKLLTKIKIYFLYRRLYYEYNSKFNYKHLQYLNKYMYLIYNKNIEYNIINLKRFYLHSDILSNVILLKLTKSRKGILNKLNKLKEKIKIQKPNLIKNIHTNTLNNKNLITSSKDLKTKVIKSLKYKYISGFRLEVKGRLTRRYTASRSVLKTKYKGNLLNIDSSFRGLSTVLLKGNLKSNIQYTTMKSKSRIGSFGIKGWVSGS